MKEQLQLDEEDISITLRRGWDRALRLLSTRVNKPTFETHIRAIRPLSLTESRDGGRTVFKFLLGVPSAFTREWVEKRHSAVITSVLEEIFDQNVQIQFTIVQREGGTPGPIADGGGNAPKPKEVLGGRDAAGTSADITKAVMSQPLRDSTAITSPSAVSSSDVPDLAAAIAFADHSGIVDDFNAPPPPATAAKLRPAVRAGKSQSSGEALDATELNPRYTFDSFVVGGSNRLAQAGAQAVAGSPGTVYNPLFLYGPSGLGKTHLMHAIGNELHGTQHSGSSPLRVAYLSGEMFTSGYVTSVREHKSEEFRRRWRTVDVWLVDDIQFIAGKEGTKEEFFHTFNALYQSGKQIVISSDRSPRELRMMDERLRSRFESGLIADIAPPDLETRLAILQRKAEIERMRIPDDVLLYMARLIKSNIRTLEGALVKLIAYASLINTPITLDLAASALERYYLSAVNDLPPAAAQRQVMAAEGVWDEAPDKGALRSFATAAGLGPSGIITPELVQRVVAKRFGLPTDSLSGKKRDRNIVFARQIAMHLTRELTQMSMPTIGRVFGGRDHTTVAYSCDKVRSQIPVDDDLRRIVDDLTIQVKAAHAPD